MPMIPRQLVVGLLLCLGVTLALPGSTQAKVARRPEAVRVEGRVQKPRWFVVLPRAPMPDTPPPADAAAVDPRLADGVARWRRAERKEQLQRDAAVRSGKAVSRSLDPSELAIAVQKALEDALFGGGPPPHLPGFYLLTLVELRHRAELDRAEAERKIYEEELARGGATPQPPRPVDLTIPAQWLETFLLDYGRHLLRPWALYMRASVEEDWHGEENPAYAGALQKLVSEYPKHTLAGEALLRLGKLHNTSESPKVLRQARRELQAAVALLADRPLQGVALWQLGVVELHIGQFAKAAERALAVMRHPSSIGLGPCDLATAACLLLGDAALALRNDAVILESDVTVTAKSDAEGAAGLAAGEAGEWSLSELWLARAQQLIPLAPRVPLWDRRRIDALIHLGRRDEAVAALLLRPTRFGPGSPWGTVWEQAARMLEPEFADDAAEAKALGAP